MASKSLATLGGGCFWCLEAVFQRLKGIEKVVSGYAGGSGADPSYAAVCNGKTGHAEVVQITYDPQVLLYKQLLDVFFHVHDPTTLNQQGNDIGTQYRSIIFYHDDVQEKEAELMKRHIEDEKVYKNPVVTEILPIDKYPFYKAEDYHQNYYNQNPSQGYCLSVVKSKVNKFVKKYPDLLKK
ncbi:unnamed protein product [Didymodactylos carnosus]|uniref:peptide-methionine (S)-S-oxide reductase n=1 Tax=Didymodactylos carnosus TaxID=1234261 RepID=A0A8S2HNV3_9BILA|nr:unnamed protein product [Didymodactylos carnosus]CAF3665238.1 unnamed protein product [Didymodactylos carnosus]